jgi:plastocyanin
MHMLRLLYLLLRQEARRKRAAPALGYAAPRRRRRDRGLVFAVGAAALAAGAGAALIVANAHLGFGPAPLAWIPVRTATLDLHVDALGSAPLVAYLDVPGAARRETQGDPEAAVQITSVNNAFQPSFQVAPVAASVDLGNQDPIPHNTHVFEGGRTLFNVAVPLSGVRVHKVLGRPGMFEVRCDFHPWMRAWLFVPSGPHHTVIRTPGTATLHDIPPGSYRLHVWQPGRGDTIRTLSFGSGEVKSLRLTGA